MDRIPTAFDLSIINEYRPKTKSMSERLAASLTQQQLSTLKDECDSINAAIEDETIAHIFSRPSKDFFEIHRMYCSVPVLKIEWFPSQRRFFLVIRQNNISSKKWLPIYLQRFNSALQLEQAVNSITALEFVYLSYMKEQGYCKDIFKSFELPPIPYTDLQCFEPSVTEETFRFSLEYIRSLTNSLLTFLFSDSLQGRLQKKYFRTFLLNFTPTFSFSDLESTLSFYSAYTVLDSLIEYYHRQFSDDKFLLSTNSATIKTHHPSWCKYRSSSNTCSLFSIPCHSSSECPYFSR